MGPLISIIVPVYKVEKYLVRCIKSIQNQTYTNIEIILVDDGSPDRCGIICDEIAREDSRIKVLHKENGGLSDARNKGIAIAQGEYVGFVDSDDYIEPDMYEHLLGVIEKYNVKLAICSLWCEDENGNSAIPELIDPIDNVCLNAEALYPQIEQEFGWFFVVAWNKLYHRSLLNESFYPYGKIHEDEFVITDLLWNAKKIGCSKEKKYHYVYMRNDSITASRKDKISFDKFVIWYRRCTFFHNHNVPSLASESRAVYFKEMEDYYVFGCHGQDMSRWQREELLRMYNDIPDKRITEQLKWALFRINPSLEKKITSIIRKIL